MNKALEALHVAATAITGIGGIINVSVDNDHDSGEIMFTAGGENFVLRLEQVLVETEESSSQCCSRTPRHRLS